MTIIKRSILLAGVCLLGISVLFVSGCGNNGNTNAPAAQNQITNEGNKSTGTSNYNSNTGTNNSNGSVNNNRGSSVTTSGLGVDTDNDGLPDTVEKTLGTNPLSADTDGDGQSDKADKNPLYTPDLIQETSTVPAPIKVLDSRVEDNVNAADHLEITIANTGNTELKDFDVYYTVTDSVTAAKEGYYATLAGLQVKPGARVTLHFDNKLGSNHYYGNTNGLYGTSKNALDFQVELHAKGFALVKIIVKKAKGTAEVAD
ncbi:MAG: hypothetical protein ACYC21_01340 [Eubacteriales bacterium]